MRKEQKTTLLSITPLKENGERGKKQENHTHTQMDKENGKKPYHLNMKRKMDTEKMEKLIVSQQHSNTQQYSRDTASGNSSTSQVFRYASLLVGLLHHYLSRSEARRDAPPYHGVHHPRVSRLVKGSLLHPYS